MTRVKICGLREKIHAVAAAEAGADFVGVIFAPSPRQVTLPQGREIVMAVKKKSNAVQTVGVFVNAPSYLVNQVADTCGLDWVQLSGNESWEYCREIKRPVIKVIRVGKGRQKLRQILAAGARLLASQQYLYLLDSAVKGKYGGTGLTFDWTPVQPLAKIFPIIVAGGLTPENVTEVIERVAPWGVDVSSGVETDGVKDVAKITAFVGAVRRWDASRN